MFEFWSVSPKRLYFIGYDLDGDEIVACLFLGSSIGITVQVGPEVLS